jgi:hypothetical protein
MREVFVYGFSLIAILIMVMRWNGYPRGMKNVDGPPWLKPCWQFRKQPYSSDQQWVLLLIAFVFALLAFISSIITIGWNV